MRGGWLAALLLGCAHAGPGVPPFDGPGRLLLILERDAHHELWVLDADGRRRVDVPRPQEARWIHPGALLVKSEEPATQEFHLPDTQLRIVPLDGAAPRPLGPVGRHYDPEPTPDGRWLAVGAETPGVGDADLEIWSLDDRERMARRAQSFEEPRWRHDGRALVASLLMADPVTDEDEGGGMLGTSFSWPRMHRLRRDLGEPTLLWDGERSDSLAPGGSLPLWWDESGIFARQRRGLVRCDPMAGGCALVYATAGTRRVVDGRRVGATEAWLLTVEARDAFDRRQPDEVLRLDLSSGEVLGRFATPEGVAVIEIDWVETP